MKRIISIIATAFVVLSFGAVEAQALSKNSAKEKTRQTALRLADIGNGTWDHAFNVVVTLDGPFESGVQWHGAFDLYRTGPSFQYCIGRMDIGQYGGISRTFIHCANIKTVQN